MGANSRIIKSEQELKAKIESIRARSISQEEALRKSNEENSSLVSKIQNLQNDFQNMIIIEDSLK